MSRLENLNVNIRELLANSLEPRDLVELATTSKQMCNSMMDNSVWKSKTNNDFGNLFEIYAIFTKSAGLELAPDLATKFSQEPTNWKEYYAQKNAAVDSADDEALMTQAEKEYSEAQAFLKTFQSDGNVSVLSRVASKMMWILDVFPTHAGCYYILGFILFVLNRLEDALIPLRTGRLVDPGFEPITELQEEIQRILQGYKGSQDETPLLEQDTLSRELKEVLEEIFRNFDRDQDGALKPEELDSFIFTTNGSHPPAPFLRQMGQRFGSNARGWLTRDGFLAFYLEQTLDDPSETRSDLGVHGYDPQSLKKRMEE
ncbi:hypothetical protein BDB00DRAFT_985557 [Zychaea mexicana]|uniref:uncharacterized protein n=1 Tax=Zychaea mexicana TaxID=64656 RepID=UPI0022FE98C9|nr:uncharacterized protein BDB00DRAFT_985557 [Zychaea mexicana]KAI9467945.1 hypothetical protein BDB00DRAFT_985557 [Zychaea mexicana]